MKSAQVSLSHRPVDDLALLGPISCCRTVLLCLSAITLSLSAWFSSRLRSSACPFTRSYVMSRPRHQFSCRSLIVLTKSWAPSMRWNMLSVNGLLVDRTADSLLHGNVAEAMLIRPDRLRVPRTARPAATRLALTCTIALKIGRHCSVRHLVLVCLLLPLRPPSCGSQLQGS
jgi:hypothetical protein